MKVRIDGQQLCELLPWEKKLLENDLCAGTLHQDCCRRIEWALKHKVDQAWEHFEKEWMKILREDPTVSSIPTDKEAFVNMVTARPDYKNRDQRDAEKKSS
jgi:hypothetical protein